MAPSTAASISASSKTINGAFPPNSIDIFKTCSEPCFNKIFPTSVEPVNVSLRTLGLEQNSFPISSELFEVKIDKTPFGRPALSAKTAMAKAERGVSSAGFATKVHPAARAGPNFLVIIAFGKFQGVIEVTTPIACFTTKSFLSD